MVLAVLGYKASNVTGTHIERKHECQWPFQEPKLDVVYHISVYVGGLPPYIALTLSDFVHEMATFIVPLADWGYHGIFMVYNQEEAQTNS